MIMIEYYIFCDFQLAFPLALLVLMVVASASAGPIEVIEISPDMGLHFDQENIDVQSHLVKRSPFIKKKFAKFTKFTKKSSASSFAAALPEIAAFGAAAGGGAGLASVAAPIALEAAGFGFGAAPAFG